MEIAGRTGPVSGSRLYMVLSLQIPRFERAVTSGLESPQWTRQTCNLSPRLVPS
jgi:hypothetical protein